MTRNIIVELILLDLISQSIKFQIHKTEINAIWQEYVNVYLLFIILQTKGIKSIGSPCTFQDTCNTSFNSENQKLIMTILKG